MQLKISGVIFSVKVSPLSPYSSRFPDFFPSVFYSYGFYALPFCESHCDFFSREVQDVQSPDKVPFKKVESPKP